MLTLRPSHASRHAVTHYAFCSYAIRPRHVAQTSGAVGRGINSLNMPDPGTRRWRIRRRLDHGVQGGQVETSGARRIQAHRIKGWLHRAVFTARGSRDWVQARRRLHLSVREKRKRNPAHGVPQGLVEAKRSLQDSSTITDSVWKERAFSASCSHYSSLLQNQFTSGMEVTHFRLPP